MSRPSGGFLHELGDANGRSVGAMRRTERVVDVEFGKLGELFGKILVVGFFFGVEAKIFEQQRLAFFELERHLFGFRANAMRDRSRHFLRATILCRAPCAGARRRA